MKLYFFKSKNDANFMGNSAASRIKRQDFLQNFSVQTFLNMVRIRKWNLNRNFSEVLSGMNSSGSPTLSQTNPH
jgi:hypothetical protein